LNNPNGFLGSKENPKNFNRVFINFYFKSTTNLNNQLHLTHPKDNPDNTHQNY
jgi:hypothetical protein